jgi:ubiquinone/menaquinone biosynthesis C-methylase UbiE
MTTDTARIIFSLEVMHPLREAPLRAAIEALHISPGSRGLDIGCGIGDLTLMIAEAMGPDGKITALDISLPLLDYAKRKISRSAFADCIEFVQGDMNALPLTSETYDWAWSVDCAGYPSADFLPMLESIRRVLRPGGVIALLAWSSQQLLPGYTLLEARLNAACSAYAPFLESQLPQAHFQRAPHWFPLAGLSNPTCSTFVGQVQAPIRTEMREGMAQLFEMLWGDSISLASEDDIETYHRLCKPTSPDFIVDLPDYYGFFTYTMFAGRLADDPFLGK